MPGALTGRPTKPLEGAQPGPHLLSRAAREKTSVVSGPSHTPRGHCHSIPVVLRPAAPAPAPSPGAPEHVCQTLDSMSDTDLTASSHLLSLAPKDFILTQPSTQ